MATPCPLHRVLAVGAVPETSLRGWTPRQIAKGTGEATTLPEHDIGDSVAAAGSRGDGEGSVVFKHSRIAVIGYIQVACGIGRNAFRRTKRIRSGSTARTAAITGVCAKATLSEYETGCSYFH